MNKIMKIIELAARLVILNLLFVFCSVPLVSVGLSFTAMLSGLRYIIKKEDFIKGWVKGIKCHIGRTLIVGTLGLGLVAYIAMNIISIWSYKLEGYIVPLVISIVFALLAIMFMTALLFVNLYIPTDTGHWLKNAQTVCLRFPLHVLAAGALMYLPLVVAYLSFSVIYNFFFILLFIYFVIAGFAGTVLMKQPLLYVLQLSRNEGWIVPEKEEKEKKRKNSKEEEEDIAALQLEHEMLAKAYQEAISSEKNKDN